jgi:hypothetical protein
LTDIPLKFSENYKDAQAYVSSLFQPLVHSKLKNIKAKTLPQAEEVDLNLYPIVWV